MKHTPALLALAAATLTAGCFVADPLYCRTDGDCLDAPEGRRVCDDTGVRPESNYVAHTCVKIAPEAATLTGLVPSAGALSPTFASAVTRYELDLGVDVTTLSFTATTTGAGAVLVVDDSPTTVGAASAPLALPLTLRTVVVALTGADGVTTEYQIAVRRGVDALASLTASDGELIPAFD